MSKSTMTKDAFGVNANHDNVDNDDEDRSINQSINEASPAVFFLYIIVIMYVYTISIINMFRCIYIYIYIYTYKQIYTHQYACKHALTHALTHARTLTHTLPWTSTDSLHKNTRPGWWLHTVLWPGKFHLKTCTLNLYNIPIRPIDGTVASFQLSCILIIISFVTRLVC